MASLLTLLDKISISKPKTIDPVKKLYDFKTSKQSHQQEVSKAAIIELQKALWELSPVVQENKQQAILLIDAISFSYDLAQAKEENISGIVAQLRKIVEKLPAPQSSPSFSLPPLPAEISADLQADVAELQVCFNARAYRSCVILCGRILEIGLHRRYYDQTEQDVLEKSPGIGLGNLIAKMKEKGISLDPALANQIHLINQVRIFSVHKKQQVFAPSKEQAQAIMLYTLDILRQLFG